MRRLAALAIATVIAGCGSASQRLPADCVRGPAAFERALRAAPGQVTVGHTRISQCFVHNASSDDVQVVGTYLLTAAQEISYRAQQGDRSAAVQLGYLIGAASRGADRNGVSTELVRRLEAEAGGTDKLHAALEQGLRAGRAEG